MKFNNKIMVLLTLLMAASVPVIAQTNSIIVGFGGTLSGGVRQNSVNGLIPTPVSSENSVTYPDATIGCPPQPTLCKSNQCWATWNYNGKSYTSYVATYNQYIPGIRSLYVTDCTISVQINE